MKTALEGLSLLGNTPGSAAGAPARAMDPATGENLPPDYREASAEEIDRAAALADRAFADYRRLREADRAGFLRAIASAIEEVVEDLVERATAETGLPEARIRMETGRTCFQLRMFANLVEEGSWVDARIDHADPERQPIPKPDIRSMLTPLGPVVVFCASNFPLAFSVAGGDTASALAAGCPVIVKAHHSHPGTAEIVGRAILRAATETGMPEGVFSLLYGPGRTVGAGLVRHPLVRAVGFTGSQKGGRALMDIAASRPEPIPVYAEMGSLNPVFLLPGALAERSGEIAAGLNASITLGAGQFCTCPGMVVLPCSEDGRALADRLAELQRTTAPAVMLNASIHGAYGSGLGRLGNANGVETLAPGAASSGESGEACAAGAALFRTSAPVFLAKSALREEVFGPATILVTHESREDLMAIARGLEGHLTGTIHGTESDLADYRDLVEILERKVGRLVFNGYPTGVEVCHAMVHGGPYPATSDGRSTSVGTGAILRFARAVSYQAFPDARLPAALREENPLGIMRLVDGSSTRD